MRTLIDAVSDNNFGEFTQLMAAGADPNEIAPVNLSTPLHGAAHVKNVEMAKILLAAGANPNATSANGYTPLHIAAGLVTMEMTLSMLQAGADPFIVAKNGKTALDVATDYNAQENIALLRRATLSAQVKRKRPPATQTRQPSGTQVPKI